MKYDALVVGAGLYGATAAFCLRRCGRRVLVLERRPHIAGNCFDEVRDGQRVCAYGAHIFHTASQKIERFVRQFADWQPVTHRKYARIGERLYAFPINLMTLHQLWGVTTPEEARAELERRRKPQADPHANLEAWCLHTIGPHLYELFVRGYTEKMWGRPCNELPATIIKRIPVRLSYDDRYFDDPFEAVPADGYTAMVGRMLDGCEVRTNTEYLQDRGRWDLQADLVVYTGPLDAFYGYRYGALAYRSLEFQWKLHATPDVQGALTVNWPAAHDPQIRTEEYKHLWKSSAPGSWICTTRPDAFDAPHKDAMYPVRDAESMRHLEQYSALAAQDRAIIGGRLGAYQYLNMDQAIGAALKAMEGVCK